MYVCCTFIKNIIEINEKLTPVPIEFNRHDNLIRFLLLLLLILFVMVDISSMFRMESYENNNDNKR